MQKKVKKLVDEIYPQLVAIRRDLHQQPELGLTEYQTAKKIERCLAEWWIELTERIEETSIVGLIKGSIGEKTIGLRVMLYLFKKKMKSNMPQFIQEKCMPVV